MVLVADDDFAITQMLSIRLKQLGFMVMRSPDASHALFGAQRLRPHLIIMDVEMPGGNGLAVAEMLGSDPEFSEIPVIVHSGHNDGLTLARCKYLGYQFVQKSPTSWQSIEAIIKSIFDIEFTHHQPSLSLSQQSVPLAAVVEQSPLQEKNPRALSAKDVDHREHSDSRSWAEIKASACNALDIDSESTLPTGSPLRGKEPTSTTSAGATTSSAPVRTTNAGGLNSTPGGMPERSKTDQFIQGPMKHHDRKSEGSQAKQATVLCIDDDPEISKILKKRLSTYGVNVLRAFGGMQGFWTAVDSRPDVIISDMAMPDGDGSYILGRIKSHPLTEDVPVIILTGQTNPGVKRAMMSMGVSAYLTKPLIFSDLLQALREHIELPEKPNQDSSSSGAVVPSAPG
jgi:CheY-like chemotaxis protein